MPKKPARTSPEDAEQLTLELARRLKKSRAAKGARGGATPVAERAPDAVDELMKRYDRSRPRSRPSGGDEPKDQ